MVTRPVYKNKEVNTPPNKMKHNSPLQGHVFLPLTCRILKRNYIFSTVSPPFCHDWQMVQEVRNFHPRNIKMIKGVQRIHINAWMWWNKMLWMTRQKKDAIMVYYINYLYMWINFSYMIRFFMIYLYWTSSFLH